MRNRHQLPIIQLEDLNIEEKEIRHDLDKRKNKNIDSRNKSAEKCKKVYE